MEFLIEFILFALVIMGVASMIILVAIFFVVFLYYEVFTDKNGKVKPINCILGFHNIKGCECTRCDKTWQHEWDGCICLNCGMRRIGGTHQWDGCKCTRCGETRTEGPHQWDGCKCTRCGGVKASLEGHQWDGCKCTYCGRTRDEEHDWDGCKCLKCNKVEHQWGEWEYISSKSCMQKRVCVRDGAEQTREVDHQWGEWEYYLPDSCQKKRGCIRCNTEELTEREFHSWGEWDTTSCQQTRHCTRCNAVDETVCHDWDVVETHEDSTVARFEDWSPVMTITTFVCRRCGETMTSASAH